jgi:peptide/nickel transport system substrate-binding protein
MTTALLAACVAPSPTAAPTKPAAPAATSAPAVVATKPAAAAPAATAAPTTAPAAKVKRGGQLRTSLAWTYPTFDSHLVSTDNLPGFRVMYDAPLRYQMNPQTNKYEPVGELFESWSFTDPVNPQFKIRKGVKFHDGSDFTADVAAFNIDRMVNHKKSTAKVYFEGVTGAEKVDADTIKIKMKAPSASLLVMLTGAYGPVGIVSQAAVDKLGDDEFGRKPVGSGPFQFSDWLSDDRLTVKKFDNHWRKGADGQALPYLDSIIFRYIQDNSVALLEMRAGSLDFTEGVDPKDMATIKADPNLVLVEKTGTGSLYFGGGFHIQKSVFSNLKLRQAFNHAIDRENMAKALTFGTGSAHPWPYWGEGVLGWEPTSKAYNFDLAKTKQLLTEAGYPNGIDITLSVISRQPEQRISEVAKQMLDQAGFRTKLDVLERLAFNAKLQGYNFEVGFWRPGLPIDPDRNTRGLYSKAAGNWSGFADTEVDKCMDEGRQSMDPAKRHDIYKRCLNIIQEQAYLFTGYLLKTNNLANKKVKGILSQYALPDLREVWLDN